MRCYFDASALVKRFKPERGQEVVKKTIEEASLGLHEIHSIHWARTEFYVAMRRGNVPQRLAARNLRVLDKIILFDDLSSKMVNDALNLVYEFTLHAADAVHLAACMDLKCDTILTDDEHLIREGIKRHLEKHAIRLIGLGEEP